MRRERDLPRAQGFQEADRVQVWWKTRRLPVNPVLPDRADNHLYVPVCEKRLRGHNRAGKECVHRTCRSTGANGYPGFE